MKAAGKGAQAQVIAASLAKLAPGRTNGQLVAAFGERAVEAELLRHHWITANINASIRNVKDFDLFAVKNALLLHVRVKTCSRNEDMQFSSRKGQEITFDDIAVTDFTVVVRMGATRNDDRFYIVPTRIVLQALNEHRRASLVRGVKDQGHWVLKWRERSDRQSHPNYGFERKWEKYLDCWHRLDDLHRRAPSTSPAKPRRGQ
jgi:hypothetical protein